MNLSLRLFAVASMGVAACALSQTPSGPRVHVPSGVALSPDGTTVAWTERSRTGAALHLTQASHPDPATEKLITVAGATDCAYTTPLWSHDGKTLAFLSDCAPLEGKQAKGQLQLFLWSRATAETRQLTHLTGAIQQPAWSPDGKAIAFLFVENASRSAGALDAMKPFAGVIGEDGVEIQRVFSVDSTTGQGSYLTPLTLHVYEFDFSPDSRQIAYVGADAPGENNWWIASLWAAGAKLSPTDVPQQPRLVVDPPNVSGPLHGLQIAVPRFSPDGKQIAFIGGLMSDQGSTGGDVYTVPSTGGAPTNTTPGIDGTPIYIAWTTDRTLGFIEDRRGHTLVVDWDNARKAPLDNGTEDLGEVSVSGGPIKAAVSFVHAGGDTLAFTMQSFTKPPEIYTLGAAGLTQLTHLNDGLKPATRTESVEWTNGPYHVQGWLTFPANFDPAKMYPIIVTVHGGPSASVAPRWSSSTQTTFADRGYFELQPNPAAASARVRPSPPPTAKTSATATSKTSRPASTSSNPNTPSTTPAKASPAGAYGGFMTMFAVTQTTRFRAAVAGAGVADWLSYYGENSIDQWLTPFFGATVYDNPAVYAKSSPITYIKQAKTPTLVIVGDRDGECPAPQSFEFWHALRDLGVKTQLVVYPNEGHGFRDPEHIRDRNERTAKWFADNMPAGTAR